MPEVHSKALGRSIQVDRIIGRVDGAKDGPCLLFFAGIHGNEPAGVFALHQVVEELKKLRGQISGSVIAISGNLWALERSVRYEKVDLNRLWKKDHIEALKKGMYVPTNEDEKQQKEIFDLVESLLQQESGPFYFFDLHTTSSATIPFITVNDSLLNRKFTKQYPVPLILGIEEYLDGPLLSYINELGYVSFGFEGGQHDELSSIQDHTIFVYLSLVFAGALHKSAIEYDGYLSRWNAFKGNQQAFYEIYDRFGVKESEHFVMKPGFSNFQSISRNEELATLDGTSLKAQENSVIFMPLYQSQGSDGYFLIRKIPHIFLWLSRVLRKYKVDHLFILLPGVSWSSDLKDAMVIDLRIARFISKQVFHLFGYRSKQIGRNHMQVKNREHRSRKDEYSGAKWYRTRMSD